MADIFISYATADKARIRPLAAALAAEGWSVFWDRTIKPGQTWQKVIGQELRQARCVVVAWTEASVESDWVLEEAGEGKKRGDLIPLSLDEVYIPFGFAQIQSADLTDWDGSTASRAFHDLVDAIADKIGTPAKEPHESQAESATSAEPPPLADIDDRSVPVDASRPVTPAAPTKQHREPSHVAGRRKGQESTAKEDRQPAVPAADRSSRYWWVMPPAIVAALFLSWLFLDRATNDRPSIDVASAGHTIEGEGLQGLRAIIDRPSVDVASAGHTNEGLQRRIDAIIDGFEADVARSKAALNAPLEVVTNDTGKLRRSNPQPLLTQPQPTSPVLADTVTEPAMIRIEPSEFLMGRNRGTVDEKPVHRVVFAQPFAIGKTEVTFDEYDAYARAEGQALPDDSGWGRGNRPVINVSWGDAVAYARWLSAKTGKSYRLPTEAEWEYAARAGTRTEYWWGEGIKQDRKVWASCHGCGSQWDNQKTAPVGSFPANPWKLSDTAGNVWEWVQDCYHDGYRQAPGDGKAWEDAKSCDTGLRVIRGGSWGDEPASLRSANRYSVSPYSRDYGIGFRLAQDF